MPLWPILYFDFRKRHKAAYQEHGVVSDLEPLTLPHLLQKIVRDPYVAWNVRSLEIWATRGSWDNWGSIALEVPAQLAGSSSTDTLYWSYNYDWDYIFQEKIEDPPQLTEEQLDSYLDLLREHAHFNEDDLDEARKEFSDGADCFYKILLIFLCPRLNSFKHVGIEDPFVRRYRGDSKEVFWWLSIVIPRSRDEESWAPGLKSLRQVALGIETGLWFQFDKYPKLYPNDVFTSILMLPNLKSVYFGRSNMDSECEWLEAQTLARYCELFGSSSIEHVFLDRMWRNSWSIENEQLFSFILGSKNLKGLTIRGDRDRIDKAAKYNGMLPPGRSLESLVGYSEGGIFGLYQHVIMARGSKRLSRITINTWSFLLQILGSIWGRITHSQMRESWLSSELHVNSENRLTEAFPKTLEVLLFQQQSLDESEHILILDVEILEEILIQLVRCKEQYPALKAIGIQQHRKDPGQCPFSDYRFSRLVEVCWENGVDAYVRGNPHPLRHQLDMPMPPTLSSFRGLEAPNANTDRVFDPLTGDWVEREVEEMEIEG